MRKITPFLTFFFLVESVRNWESENDTKQVFYFQTSGVQTREIVRKLISFLSFLFATKPFLLIPPTKQTSNYIKNSLFREVHSVFHPNCYVSKTKTIRWDTFTKLDSLKLFFILAFFHSPRDHKVETSERVTSVI